MVAQVPAATLSPPDVDRLGQRLFQDERNARAGTPLSDEFPEMSVLDAYAVQLFKIDQPDYGHLLDDMLLPDGAVIAMRGLIQPRVEPEIAFILREPLHGPGVTPTKVLLATAGVVPCFEIIDSRIRDWNITFRHGRRQRQQCALCAGRPRGCCRRPRLATARSGAGAQR